MQLNLNEVITILVYVMNFCGFFHLPQHLLGFCFTSRHSNVIDVNAYDSN